MDYLSEKQTLYEEEDRILMHKDGTETDILFVCFIWVLLNNLYMKL